MQKIHIDDAIMKLTQNSLSELILYSPVFIEGLKMGKSPKCGEID